MTTGPAAILLSAGVTASVALAGAVLLWVVSRGSASRAALGAPFVVVASLAAGVAAATKQMAIGIEDYRTVVFVLLAGAPMAVLIGVIIARRVRAMEQQAAAERAGRERTARVEADRRETIRWLSHDLRTPLSGIRLLAESLRENAVDSEQGRGLDRILTESDRLDAMVGDIAELSRLHGDPSAGRTREAVDLSDLTSDAAAANWPLADAGDVTLVAARSDSVVVVADPQSLGRALSNLVRNAVQHTPAGGRVTLEVTAAPVPMVSVSDLCGGIPRADLPHVFEPGFRGDVSRTGSGAGMGLGLAIAREIARAHGGEVSVMNRPDGTGCTFSLTLPTS